MAKQDIFVVDLEVEVVMLDDVGEETFGFPAEFEEGTLEEESDRGLEDGILLELILRLLTFVGCVAIWPVTVPRIQGTLEEAEPPILHMCNEAQGVIGVEDGALTSVG